MQRSESAAQPGKAYFHRIEANAPASYRAQDPRAIVRWRLMSLPTGKALKLTVILKRRIGSPDEASVIENYNVVHDGVGYDVEYQAPLDQASEPPVFNRSARTIRFTS